MSELQDLDGVGKVTEEKLRENGISTLMRLAVTTPAEIADFSGLSEKQARKIISQARNKLDLGLELASEYVKKRREIKKIPTGCSNFDEILGGGFESGTLTEVYGPFSSGKSQLSHILCVNALKNSENSKSIFIDTEGTFRDDRIRQIAENNGLEPDDVMNRIYMGRAYTSDHQILLLDEVEKLLQEDDDYRVLVVDSLTSHFRSEYIGRGELAKRQQLLNKHMHQLMRLGSVYNLVILVTNQVVSDPGIMYGNPEKPIGGNIIAHNSTFRIYLRPSKKNTRYAKLVDSPNLPPREAYFIITEKGFENV